MAELPVPRNETERLADLHSLGLLDTPPDQRFDRITRLAQRLFDVPIALVSLVDENRQWFKSRFGLDVAETPREFSFCAHAIVGDGVLHVVDATDDDRFRDNPLVTDDPLIRFYAGCPIESPNGHKLGTLCVIDRRPRALDPADLQALQDLAGLVEEEIAAHHLATTDPLTQLSNRRGLILGGNRILSFARRLEETACLVFVDLDGMKAINDELGHEAGDRALVRTARLLTTTFRESDIVARLGGDEFCVLFTGASARTAPRAIDRLHAAVDEDPGEPRLALSVGLADWDPATEETLEELLQRADHAMYTHKRSKKS